MPGTGRELTVTLNDDVVFQNDDLFRGPPRDRAQPRRSQRQFTGPRREGSARLRGPSAHPRHPRGGARSGLSGGTSRSGSVARPPRSAVRINTDTRRLIMFRALSILAAVAALAVTPAPASAGSLKKPSPRTTRSSSSLEPTSTGLWRRTETNCSMSTRPGFSVRGSSRKCHARSAAPTSRSGGSRRRVSPSFSAGRQPEPMSPATPQGRGPRALAGKAKVPRRGGSFGDTPGLSGGDCSETSRSPTG